MNTEEGKENKRFSAYRKWKLSIANFKMRKETAKRKLFSRERR